MYLNTCFNVISSINAQQLSLTSSSDKSGRILWFCLSSSSVTLSVRLIITGSEIQMYD